MAGKNPESGSLIIAGDGYAYLPYRYQAASTSFLNLLRVSSSGEYDDITVSQSAEWYADEPAMITNADSGILITWLDGSHARMAKVSGTDVQPVNAPIIGGGGPYAFTVPVLQAQDGSFVGSGWDGSWNPFMIAFDATGNVRWSVAGCYEPKIATADGGVIAKSCSAGVMTFDSSGNAVGEMSSLLTQSWTGNEYTNLGSIASISAPPVFPEGSSYWSQAGGNPSGNGSAFAQCPCLLQSAGVAPMQTSAAAATLWMADRTAVQPADSGALLKTYVILEGDPGLNLGYGRNHNVGNLFHLAAGTEQDALNAQGNLAGEPKRVSSVQDFAAQLTNNGPITGGVVYFGHGRGVPYRDGTRSSALAPGEQPGPDTNITAENVNLLSNVQLDTRATVTLHACYAGYGSGRYSIAQLTANQLQRTVYAPTAGAFFSVDPNSHLTGGTAPTVPDQKPIYQIQDFGKPFTAFRPF